MEKHVATPTAGCGVERLSLRRSSMACGKGLFVSMAILTAFPRGFMKHSASFLEDGKGRSA